MDSIRIGYFADGPWAHEALIKILADDSMVVSFICGRYDTQDELLEKMAFENRIPFLRHKNVNSQEFLNTIKDYGCDLFVSMSFNQILKKEFINLPPLKTINCHAGKLPFYRGRNILNWVLINDEKEFGITVHYVDEGIDTGDIILQKTFPITDDDDYSSLLQTAYSGCSEVLHNAITLVKIQDVTRVKQSDIHPVGIYCGMRKMGDEILNWNQESRTIFNFIRAICTPGPMARSLVNGDKEIKINKARMIPDAPIYIGIPGQVVGKNGYNIIVKTKDTTLEILEYELDGKIKIGDRLL